MYDNMECDMSDVKKVRNGLDNDGPHFDYGVDCSVDPDTGELLESMTKQSFVDDCDINTIMRRYEATGAFPDHMNQRAGRGQFGDFSAVADFQSALNTVIEAEAMFADLPARVRDRFGNDPEQLLRFVQDDKNRDEAIELGLVPPPAPVPAPVRVEVVPVAAAPSPASPGAATPPQPSPPVQGGYSS